MIITINVTKKCFTRVLNYKKRQFLTFERGFIEIFIKRLIFVQILTQKMLRDLFEKIFIQKTLKDLFCRDFYSKNVEIQKTVKDFSTKKSLQLKNVNFRSIF